MYKLPIPSFTPVFPEPTVSDLLAFWQVELENMPAEHILKWTFDTFASQVAFAPSWTEEDSVINALLEQRLDSVPTAELIYDLLLPETWMPLESHETIQATFDGRSASAGLWARFHMEHLCKRHEKIIGRYQAWIVSARREQHAALAHMPVLSWNERFGILRIAPLAHWPNGNADQKIRHIKTPSSDPFPAWEENCIRTILTDSISAEPKVQLTDICELCYQ